MSTNFGNVIGHYSVMSMDYPDLDLDANGPPKPHGGGGKPASWHLPMALYGSSVCARVRCEARGPNPVRKQPPSPQDPKPPQTQKFLNPENRVHPLYLGPRWSQSRRGFRFTDRPFKPRWVQHQFYS